MIYPASFLSRFVLGGALLVGLLCAGCKPAPEGGGETKTLKELSPEQLRVFLRGYDGDWRGDTAMRRGLSAPPARKPVPAGAERIDLPAPAQLPPTHQSFDEVVKARRSCRAFADTPLSLEELSRLLWSTQGVATSERDAEGRVISQLRTVPSGGGRNPLETYLLVHRVQGLKPGLYRFLPFEHQLCLLRSGDSMAGELAAACYGQKMVREAAVVFVWTAVPERSEWKYGYIAHRMIAIEAGHVCQNLYLSATAMDAAACAMLAYAQQQMDALLGLDGQEEFTVYTAAVGKVAGR